MDTQPRGSAAGQPRTDTQPGRSAAEPALRHEALLYDSDERYVDGLLPFIDGGITRREPVFVAVPLPRIKLLRAQLNDARDSVRFADMTGLGANPHRIIPAIGDFIDQYRGRCVRFVDEPIWYGRGPAELDEAACHEALINVAFADRPIHILCPYDASALDPKVLDDAERTHPQLIGRQRSRHYADPADFCRPDAWPLSNPPESATVITYRDPTDLTTVRGAVRAAAEMAGIGDDRGADAVLAVNELCANTMAHTDGAGQLRIWQEPTALICQTTDGGSITDPLAGRRRATADQIGGRGLYLINHLADVTQIRSSGDGTTIRLTFYL